MTEEAKDEAAVERFGPKVKAYPLDGSGPKVGFLLHKGGPDDDGKDAIQVGADSQPLALRDPPYGDAGPNGTYTHV